MNSRPFFPVSLVDVVVLNCWPLYWASPFSFSHLSMSMCWTTGRSTGLPLFSPFTLLCIAGSCDNITPFLSAAQETDHMSDMLTWSGKRTCLQVWCLFLLFWSLVRFNCAPNSGVEHISRPEGCDLKAEGLWALSRNFACVVDASCNQLVPHGSLFHVFLRSPLSR